ncbi:hypothetical protein F5883DRAFT_247468 [Diaporthe sp. PMI_573]|nr:hypothetical protein F5883DRAFT_247468 [Diaporthaceae sp. PMI_573]
MWPWVCIFVLYKPSATCPKSRILLVASWSSSRHGETLRTLSGPCTPSNFLELLRQPRPSFLVSSLLPLDPGCLRQDHQCCAVRYTSTGRVSAEGTFGEATPGLFCGSSAADLGYSVVTSSTLRPGTGFMGTRQRHACLKLLLRLGVAVNSCRRADS